MDFRRIHPPESKTDKSWTRWDKMAAPPAIVTSQDGNTDVVVANPDIVLRVDGVAYNKLTGELFQLDTEMTCFIQTLSADSFDLATADKPSEQRAAIRRAVENGLLSAS